VPQAALVTELCKALPSGTRTPGDGRRGVDWATPVEGLTSTTSGRQRFGRPFSGLPA